MIVQILTISIGLMPTSVRQELVSGTIERFLVSAHGPVNGILGVDAVPILNALFSGPSCWCSPTLIFGLPLDATARLAIPVALLGTLAFMPFALLPGRAGDGVQASLQRDLVHRHRLAIVGGLYFPIALLPDWIEWISEVQPFTPATDLLRHLSVGHPATPPGGYGAAQARGLSPSCWCPRVSLLLRVAIRHGQRAGTIVEY